MASVRLYDAETGQLIDANDERETNEDAADVHEAGIVLAFDPGTGTAWTRFAVEGEADHLVAGVRLSEDDELSDLYRAVQGAVQERGERIAHPRKTEDALNLVHYLAAPRPDPPDQSIRGHLVATDAPIGVEAPTAADAAGVLAFFREQSPWKTLVVHEADAPAASTADVTLTIDRTVPTVTYRSEGERWVDGDAHVDALPDDQSVGALPGDVGTEAGRSETASDDAGTGRSRSKAVADTVEASTGGPDEGARTRPRRATAPDSSGGPTGRQSDGEGQSATGNVNATTAEEDANGTAETSPGAETADGDVTAGADDGESLSIHHEQQLRSAVTDLRNDLAAITDQVDAITGTIAARQRVFATALSGGALGARGLTAVPAEDERLASRRRQVRGLTACVLLAAGLAAGFRVGATDALAPLLTRQYVVDLGVLSLPWGWVVVEAPVLLAGSLLLAGAAALWVLAPERSPRGHLAALRRGLNEQFTVVGSGSVPTEVGERAETVHADLDDVAETAARVARREGRAFDFETFLSRELLATPGLPAVDVVDRGTRRRDRVAAVVRGLLGGVAVAGAVLGVLGIGLVAAATEPALVLDAFTGLAVVALLAVGGKAMVVVWRSGGRPAAAVVRGVVTSLPDVLADRSRQEESVAGGPQRGTGPAGGRGDPPAAPAGTTAPAFEHDDRDLPTAREGRDRNWRLLLTSLGFLVVVGLDVAIYRGPLSLPDAVPQLLVVSVMWLVPIVLATLAAVYWAFDV